MRALEAKQRDLLVSKQLQELKYDVQTMREKIDAAEARGDTEGAERLRREAAERTANLEDFVREMRSRERPRSLEAEQGALAELKRQAEVNSREIERMKIELDRMRAERERQRSLQSDESDADEF